MGEVVNGTFWQRSRRLLTGLALTLPLALWGLSCASAPAATAETTAEATPPAAQAAEPAAASGAAAAEADAVVVRSVTVVERAPETAVLVEGDGALIWTGYRDAEGRLVVEIPGSRPAAGLTGAVEGAGEVTGVEVIEASEAGWPVTRLIVATRGEGEHSMSGEGERLEIVLMPSGTPAATGDELAYEPLPDPEPPALRGAGELAAPAPAEQPPAPDAYARDYAAAGTPYDPVVAPPPAGRAATRLEGVEVLPSSRGTEVRIAGDGEFRYSTFVLEDPHRFVIDLLGVVNDSRTSNVPVSRPDVERVRVAQFKPMPEPVSRVVFDLEERAVPQLERDAQGLLVRFGTPPPAQPAIAAAESAPTGTGAEDDRQVAARGGSETGAQDPALEDEVDEIEEVETTPSRMAALDPQQPGQEEAEVVISGDEDEVTATVVVEEDQEPAPPLAPPRTGAGLERGGASDVSLFGGGQVAIDQPVDTAAGTQSFSPQTVGGTERRYVGEPITFSLRDADLVETLRAFAVISGLNMVIQPGVGGTVTVQLEDVPWDQAFEQILKINDLGYELEGNVMRIAPTNVLQAEAVQRQQLEQARALSVPLLTVIKRLSYANANQVANLLRAGGGVLSQRGSVIVDQRTNTLIIKELPAVMDTAIAVIENLDIAEPQVMIEARIVETRKNFTRTLGVDWSVDGIASPATGNPTGLVFPASVDGVGGVNLVTGGDNGFIGLSLGTLGGTFNVDIALQAAENEGLVNILSAPKVATLNNERAEIQSGFQIPIQTVSNNTVSVQFVNATLRLSVTPQVTAEGTILMDINIQKRQPQFALQVQGATAAPIATQEARTRVIVRDGGTTVIGGIYEVTTDEGEDRVPGLANIPILGHLFKNHRRSDQNSELLIFITPRVMRL